MPYADFGEEVKIGGGNLFVSLKDKDEKIKYRILGKPYYDGIHFISKGEKQWDRIGCPRVNDGSPCDYCNQYFDILNAVEDKKDKTAMDKAKETARPYQATITFYYPIINRDIKQFQIFKTKKSVRDYIEGEAKNGVPVLERDFITTRTENPGSGYYSTSRVDSADSQPLTPAELDAIADYKTKSLEKIIYGASQDDSSEVDNAKSNGESIEESKKKIRESLKEPEPTEPVSPVDEVNVEDIPF